MRRVDGRQLVAACCPFGFEPTVLVELIFGAWPPQQWATFICIGFRFARITSARAMSPKTRLSQKV